MQHLLVRARQALGWNQRELGERLGSSHRTAVRWEGGHSHFSASYAAKLVKLVYPIDRDLAWEIATISGLTLIGLGLEAPLLRPSHRSSSCLRSRGLAAVRHARRARRSRRRPRLHGRGRLRRGAEGHPAGRAPHAAAGAGPGAQSAGRGGGGTAREHCTSAARACWARQSRTGLSCPHPHSRAA